jgi:predicted GNAT family acetyltransferase
MATLAELLRQGADTIVNMPTEAKRFMTNPQAFTQALTGKNFLPRETGFSAGALGVPANSQNIEYQQGFQQGEPYELPIALASMGAPLVVPAAKALAPKAAQMAENYMVKQGFMPSVVEQTSKPVSQSSLQSIVDPIRERGLILDAYESKKSPLITLSRIEVPKEMRGTGMGTQALQDLSQYADQSAKTIALSPSKDFGASSVSRLKDFYKRFGFVENKGKNKDFSISETMYRLPTQPTRKEIIQEQINKIE